MNRRIVAGFAAAATLLVACGGEQNGTTASSPADTSQTSTTDVPSQQSAPEVTGPWNVVPGATNGQILLTTPARQFFRVTQ